MLVGKLLEQYIEPMVRGQRRSCRELVQGALDAGLDARTIYSDVVWPAMERVDRMYRDDAINSASEHLAARVNRTIADHLQTQLRRLEPIERRILISCAAGETEEVAAQMAADLFEAEGWDVYFVGGGVPEDEMVTLVGHLRPDLLLILGSKPSDAPAVRKLIDRIREIGACPTMNIMVSGGVFNRASGLWQEVKADLFARTIGEAIDMANGASPRTPETRVPGAPKKRRRRRRPPLLAMAERQSAEAN